MEKKRSVNWSLVEELAHGKELAQQLSNHFINPCPDSPHFLLSQIHSCYDKAISVLTSDSTPNDHLHKKRKTVTKEVKTVCSAAEGTGLLRDGYSWRKYGQKDILGALHPRAYYRCTHRDSQGCLATKQVQKSDHDPTVFEVSHRGRHTCVQSTRLAAASASQRTNEPDQRSQIADLKVETQNLNDAFEDDILSSFSFPCDDPVGLDDIFGYSPAFVSPATSGGSNYFSDLTVSAGTSASNSPVGDFDFSFDNLESFSFDFQSP